ncbi:MAG: hypothetical protein RR048_01615, partial [Oscillospiraceae bacterium]
MELLEKNKYQDTINSQKPQYRLFFDMDGTLAKFNPTATLEELLEKGYFENLEPMENVISAVKSILNNTRNIEVYILSS